MALDFLGSLAAALGGGLGGYQDYQRLQSMLEERKSREEERKSRAEARKEQAEDREAALAIREANMREGGIRRAGEVDPTETIRKPGTWLMQPKYQDLGNGFLQETTATKEYEGQQKVGDARRERYEKTVGARTLDPRLSLDEAYALAGNPAQYSQFTARRNVERDRKIKLEGLKGLLGREIGGITVDDAYLDALVTMPELASNALRTGYREQFPPQGRQPPEPNPGSNLNYAQDLAGNLVRGVDIPEDSPSASERIINSAWAAWANDPNRDKSLDASVLSSIKALVRERERERRRRSGASNLDVARDLTQTPRP